MDNIFVAGQAKSILPRISDCYSASRNIIDYYISLVLVRFIEAGLIEVRFREYSFCFLLL